MTEDRKIIKVGSRKSELALIQTRYVISLLNKKFPTYEYQIVTMNTLGDQVLDKPLPKIGEKSLFTKELEIALAAGCVDFVVHSLKDLPTCLPEGMAIGAVLKREDPRDAVVIRKSLVSTRLGDLKEGSVIGTSSLRRTAQLSRLYPHLKIENIRGNLNTRLKKLDEMDIYSAIILAKAGLTRMGWSSRISQILDSSEIMYAVGQGALAVECRESDLETLNMLSKIHHPETLLSVLAERSFLRTLEGGCSAPVAVCTLLEENSLKLTGAVWSLDGKTLVSDSDACYCKISENYNGSFDDIDLVKNSEKISLNENKRLNISTNDNSKETTHFQEDSSNIRKCPFSDSCTNKKLKADNGVGTEIENNLINVTKCPYSASTSDDSCPISTLPVGVDFMGKCPYLEQKEATNCPVNAEIIVTNPNTEKVQLKCPYFNTENGTCNENCNLKNLSKSEKHDYTKLFCGLVGSKFVSNEFLRNAENLGVNLAKKLIEKGAKIVMEEAQAHIRGTSHEINKVRT